MREIAAITVVIGPLNPTTTGSTATQRWTPPRGYNRLKAVYCAPGNATKVKIESSGGGELHHESVDAHMPALGFVTNKELTAGEELLFTCTSLNGNVTSYYTLRLTAEVP